MNFPKNILDKLANWVNKHQNLVLFLGVIFVAFFWRLYNINSVPAVIIPSEKNTLNTVKTLIEHHWQILPKDIPNAIYLYMIAGVSYLTKSNVLILRIFQALVSAASVGLFYAFVKNWFNRQTALLAGLLLATSSFHLIFSRGIEPKVLIIPLLVAFLYTVTNALRSNSLVYFMLSGILAGMAFYIDQIFIFFPLIFIVALAYFYYKNKKALLFYLRNIVLAVTITLIIIAPYIYFSSAFLPEFLNEIKTSIGIFYLNLGAIIKTLFYESQIRSIYSTGIEPIFDPFVTVSFIAGLVYALFYMRRKKFLILSAWFIFFILLISLRITTDYSDFIFLLVPVYVLASIMLDYVLTNWVRTFPFNRSARLLMTFVFSLFIFLSIFYNYQKYFKAWNSNLKENIKLEYRQ